MKRMIVGAILYTVPTGYLLFQLGKAAWAGSISDSGVHLFVVQLICLTLGGAGVVLMFTQKPLKKAGS